MITDERAYLVFTRITLAVAVLVVIAVLAMAVYAELPG